MTAMVKRFRTEKQKSVWSFSDWIHPIGPNYLLACCDCGLVHEVQFRLDKANRLNLRARRHIKHTARRREKMKGQT